MTDEEYLVATNLAKIRASKKLLQGFVPVTEADKVDEETVMLALTRLEERISQTETYAQL